MSEFPETDDNIPLGLVWTIVWIGGLITLLMFALALILVTQFPDPVQSPGTVLVPAGVPCPGTDHINFNLTTISPDGQYRCEFP